MRHRNPDRIKYLGGLCTIFFLLLLSGCVSSSDWIWQHPDKQGELQLLKDKKECRDLAQSEVAQSNYFYDYYDMYDFPYYWPYYRDSYRRPYFRGYGHYRFRQQQDNLERFFRVCMKSKGWERVEIEMDPKKLQ
ncbi:MAG: hypothetical protein QM483_06040 [Desulfuromusa sp.]